MKTIEPPSLLPLHQAEGLARDEEIALRQDVHVAVPGGERGVLDRGGEGDAGVGDENVEAAEGNAPSRRSALATAASSVTSMSAPRTLSLPWVRPSSATAAVERGAVDVGEHDAGALGEIARAIAAADAAGPRR